MTSRRAFLVTLAGGLLVAPLAAGAQPPRKTPRVGLLGLTSASTAVHVIEAFRASLRALGYVEGRTIAIEYRWAEGRTERLPELAAQLVALKVDVIVTGGHPAILAARKATTTIPIVMAFSVDAVETGLISSLARPGGNITGLSVPSELGAKQLDLLRELVPSLSRVATLVRSNPGRAAQRAQGQAMVQALLGVTLEFVEVREPADLPGALAKVSASGPEAMIVGPDALFYRHLDQIVGFARTVRLPAMYPTREFVEAGGLISFSANLVEAHRRVVFYIDRILKGARPADLPVEQPATFELVLNRKTAKALGLTIPPSLLLRTDQVIE